MRTGDFDLRGELAREAVRNVVRRHLNEVRFCWEQALAAGQARDGRVGVTFVVGETGAVQLAALAYGTGEPHLDGCVVQAVRRWTFPAPRRGVAEITFPFVLDREP